MKCPVTKEVCVRKCRIDWVCPALRLPHVQRRQRSPGRPAGSASSRLPREVGRIRRRAGRSAVPSRSAKIGGELPLLPPLEFGLTNDSAQYAREAQGQNPGLLVFLAFGHK